MGLDALINETGTEEFYSIPVNVFRDSQHYKVDTEWKSM